MKLLYRAMVLLMAGGVLAGTAYAGQSKAKKTSSPSKAAPATAQSSSSDDYSGMYSFLKEGEFVQITVEEGLLLGFVSRMGDLDSDRGVFLDQFFDKGKIKGNQISFTTKPVHGTWYEFQGHVDRGPAKTKKEEGYWLLVGTLKENSTDVDQKVTSRSREVSFKSFPEDDDTGDEEPVPHTPH